MKSEIEAYCSKELPFKQTRVNEYAIAVINTQTEKGFSTRFCKRTVNDTNPLLVTGEWQSEEKRIVMRKPNRGYVFNEFILILHGVNADTAFIDLPGDIEYLYTWIFEEEKVNVENIKVYRVEDSTYGSISTITLFVQIQSGQKLAKRVQKIIINTVLVIDHELVKQFPQRYSNTIEVLLNGNPVIIIRSKETWEIIVEVSIVIVTLSLVIALCLYYRKPIRKWYLRGITAYRERRRMVVFEEYNIPCNMYYEPTEIRNNTTLRSFETPYGEMYLVEPLIQKAKVEYAKDFVVAVNDV